MPTIILCEARGLWLFWVIRGGIGLTRRLGADLQHTERLLIRCFYRGSELTCAEAVQQVPVMSEIAPGAALIPEPIFMVD